MSLKLFKKSVSILTLLIFIATNTIYAAPDSKSIFKNKKVDRQKISDKNQGAMQQKKAVLGGEDIKSSESQKREAQKILSSHLSDISLIHIPAELGKVVEAYQDPDHDNSKLIVHIQDLHTNPEAELNLAKILEILLKDYKMGLVCSEGADGAVDTSSVSSFPDAEVREKVARLFINSGELTGEEYLSITKYPDMPIWGIENKDIYFKNIDEFNKIMEFDKDSQVFISQTKDALEALKPKIYSKDLLDISQKENDYADQKIETPDYLKYLSSYIQKLNIPVSNYENIAILNETVDKEAKIDQQKIMQESQNLLLNLQSAIAAQSNRSDIDTLMAKASLFKDQKISPFSFYSYLKDLADKHLKENLVKKYPNLMDFVDYLAKVNSLDSTQLFIEMEDLAYEVKQKLARNDEEKNLTQALRNIKFLEGFFNLKVSNEELDYYLANRDSHKVSFFEGFLKPALKKYNLSSFIDFNANLIDSHFQELEDFYKTAKSRDLVMFNNTVSEVEKRNVKVAALVTGGFHTKGITKLLKEKGYSYIVISPYSKTEIDEENYHFLLSGKRKPIEELIGQLDLPQDTTDKLSAKLRVPMTFGEGASRIQKALASNESAKGSCFAGMIDLAKLTTGTYIEKSFMSRHKYIELRKKSGVSSDSSIDKEIAGFKLLGIVKHVEGGYIFQVRLSSVQIGSLPRRIKRILKRWSLANISDGQIADTKYEIAKAGIRGIRDVGSKTEVALKAVHRATSIRKPIDLSEYIEKFELQEHDYKESKALWEINNIFYYATQLKPKYLEANIALFKLSNRGVKFIPYEFGEEDLRKDRDGNYLRGLPLDIDFINRVNNGELKVISIGLKTSDELSEELKTKTGMEFFKVRKSDKESLRKDVLYKILRRLIENGFYDNYRVNINDLYYIMGFSEVVKEDQDLFKETIDRGIEILLKMGLITVEENKKSKYYALVSNLSIKQLDTISKRVQAKFNDGTISSLSTAENLDESVIKGVRNVALQTIIDTLLRDICASRNSETKTFLLLQLERLIKTNKSAIVFVAARALKMKPETRDALSSTISEWIDYGTTTPIVTDKDKNTVELIQGVVLSPEKWQVFIDSCKGDLSKAVDMVKTRKDLLNEDLPQPAVPQAIQGKTLASNEDIKAVVTESLDAYADIHGKDKREHGVELSIVRLGADNIRALLSDTTLSETQQGLVKKLLAFGKGSVFSFWEGLDAGQRQNLLSQLAMVDMDNLERLYKTFIIDKKQGADVKVTENNIAMPKVVDVIDTSGPDYAKAFKRGENAFRNGEVCYLELAGGTGSRLGYQKPKIMFKTSQVMNMSLARMRAKKIRALAEEYGKPVPWLIMTSDVTDKETREFFKERIVNNKYFGEVPVAWVRFVRQRVMPQIADTGEFILNQTKDSIIVGGFGHGDARDYVLKDKDVLKWLKGFGIKYIVMLNVDNAYIPGAPSIGYHIAATEMLPPGTEKMSVHSVEKAGPGEKVGMNVLLNGRSAVIEYNQVPDRLLYMTYVYILNNEKIVFLKEHGKYRILKVSQLEAEYKDSFQNPKWVTANLITVNELPQDVNIDYLGVQYIKDMLIRAKLWLLLGNTNGLIWSLDSFTDEAHPLPELPVVVAKNKAVDGYHPETREFSTKTDARLKAHKFECMAFQGFFGNPVTGAFILVPRPGYFAPIKEAKGQDSPERARELFTQYDASLLSKANWMVATDAIVELTPAFSFLDGRYLPSKIDQGGIVGRGSKLYLSGRNVHIGSGFNIAEGNDFILRFNNEYNRNAGAQIGNNVEIQGDISITINGSGNLIIDDDVIITGHQEYTVGSNKILHITKNGSIWENRETGEALASNGGIVPGRVDLKMGPADTKWWEQATMVELAKNPTPWGNDPIVPVEKKKGVLEVTLTAKMFEKWNPENTEGRDLDASTNKYDEIGPLAIAGIRHVMNIANAHDTRQVKNSVERLLTTVALGLMIKMKYNKGAGFPFLTNYGHEVRYNSQEFQDITTRALAAMGFICNVVPGNVPVAIWDTSTMGKMFDMPLSFCGTASHSPSSVDGLKIMDNEGSQFLISDIQALIAIKKAIVKHIKEKGSFTFTLAAENDPRVTDQLYRSTDNGMAVYKEYQEKTAADEFVLGLIRTLDPSKVHIDCMYGSGYRTLTAFFKKMGLEDVTGKIDWMHTEERPDFGNIGKVQEDPRTGKPKLFDLGADGTQMMERVMPDGTIVKYFPVLCTADYPEKLARMPIGDIILPTDMDNDRLFYIQIMANDDATRKLLDETGVVYNVINAEKIAAVHIPNKSFHLLQDMNLQRIVALMKQGKIDKNRTIVILKTLASTPAVDQWAEKKAMELEKEGIKLRVINTAVGFAKLANVMYRTEGDMRAHPGEDVIISDAAGKDINIGTDPIILAAWEESGGIIVGTTEKISDLLGNSFLAMREKSATESIFLSLALISKLQHEKGAVNFAAYLKEIYDESGVTTPKDLRYDNALYVPAATKESALEEIAGNERKNRIFGSYLSIVIAKMRNQLSVEEAKKILKDMFDQEYEARKTQAQLSPVLIERFNNVNFDFLKDIWFTGDGVMFVFEKEGKQWFILFRPSGTEPKLKAYGFGEDLERLAIDAWDFGFNENTAGRLPESFTSNTALMDLWGSDGVKAVDKGRRMQQAWEDFGLVVDPQELKPAELGQLETRRLVRKFSPPDNHLELVNQWLKERGLPVVDIDFSKPQAMPQKAIVELLESVPEEVYNTLGHTKEEVLVKENRNLASNANLERERHEAKIIADKLTTPLNATGNPQVAASFLQGGYGQKGYGIPDGAAINGSFAIKGDQGYFTRDDINRDPGRMEFLTGIENIKEFFERRAKRLGKPIQYVIKIGIGGQHTPFQGIADVFQVISAKTGVIAGEYELGKDFEATMTDVLADIGADWDQVAVIPSSKSGSTDETMMVFVEIFHALLKHQAEKEGFNGEEFADRVLNVLHEVNFINNKERPGKDMFKVEKSTEGTDNLITLISELGYPRAKVKDIFARVLGNMFFETTDRVDQSRLSAFIHNPGLDKELGEDAPGFGAMFDNVGGRWTGDLHMMTFLAYYGLDYEGYWAIRREGILDVREGNSIANAIGNKILDEGITDIALVVPDEFFWFGKSCEQNFNESIWQEGFANLVAIKESLWGAQKNHYVNNSKRLVINLSDTEINARLFNVVSPIDKEMVENWKISDRQELQFAVLFSTFYGITTVVGDRLIVRALNKAGFTADDVDLNDVNNPATRIVQENLYLRQPYVELGKGLLEKSLTSLQEKEASNPGAINTKLEAIKKSARDGRVETNIEGLGIGPDITNLDKLADAIYKASEFAEANGRKFVPFIYLEGGRFYDLRDYMISLGIEWVMQGTGDQHISYQQVLAQPQKFLPFIISFIPEKTLPGRPAIGFAKGYLDNVSPNMVRDLFAEASYKALTESRKDQGGLGLFLRMIDSDRNIQMLKEAAKAVMLEQGAKLQTLASNETAKPKFLDTAAAAGDNVLNSTSRGLTGIPKMMQYGALESVEDSALAGRGAKIPKKALKDYREGAFKAGEMDLLARARARLNRVTLINL